MNECVNAGPVWVVFTGHADLWWLKWLRPGFRHCYVLFRDRWQWVSIDPLSHYTQVEFHAHVHRDFDLPAWLRGQGMTVVQTTLAAPPRRCAPLMPFTCVEAVKRFLGIHRRLIITPWQLHHYLTQKGSNNGIAKNARQSAKNSSIHTCAG